MINYLKYQTELASKIDFTEFFKHSQKTCAYGQILDKGTANYFPIT